MCSKNWEKYHASGIVAQKWACMISAEERKREREKRKKVRSGREGEIISSVELKAHSPILTCVIFQKLELTATGSVAREQPHPIRATLASPDVICSRNVR